MNPFKVDGRLERLLSQYPDSTQFLEAATSLVSREMLVRLWLTEGIPFAFRDCPALYETTRAWLAARWRVCPKEITLV